MTGLRKLLFGAWAFGLVWAFTMWAPGITEKSREHAMILEGTIATGIIGANMYEYRQKRKTANSGEGQLAPPEGPGAAPAASMEEASAVDCAPIETERKQ
jgi:hypothetical protein